ncbi:hypothetical protein C0966_04775 [Bacillus methanolicus]|uniref:hypothetical protein n=1 Tax=Bacillus methanolicus TaxID=1471 RepID=UPI00238017E2|nr:hypothetical protein [Bacillus methanolicus]MDE3838700.1 hypothetical protein [Bacillus methanolicus]
MTRTEKFHQHPKSFFWKGMALFVIFSVAIVTALYFFSQSLIKVEAPKKDYGRKVIIQLPNGKEVLTYENLIVKEDGKIFYKGENNKIDLTGGNIVYEDWK